MPDAELPLALIVEDEAVLALLAEDLLMPEGFETVSVSSLAEVVAMAAAARHPAVAVVNLRLFGKLIGHDLIRVLRSQIPDLPVVVMTGFQKDAPEADLRSLGWPTVRLHKPEGYPDLVAAVRDVIEQRRTGRRPNGGRRATDRCGAAPQAGPRADLACPDHGPPGPWFSVEEAAPGKAYGAMGGNP